MPRAETVISLFVASPSDVKEERECLKSVLSELNQVWGRDLALRFELLRWEESVHPNIGAYPQEVINRQIGDEYDVLVAIFWGRIGSPTKDYASGTVEELYRALERNKLTGSVDIMVYFKDAPISPSKVDTEQLAKLNSLRTDLAADGCLYSIFDDIASFESMIRTHLSAVAQKFSSQIKSNSQVTKTGLNPASDSLTPETVNSPPTEIIDIEEYGVFDYMEIFETKFSSINESLNVITTATLIVGERLSKRTTQMHAITSTKGTVDRSQARKIVDLTSDDFNEYANTLKTQVKIIKDSRILAFDALSRAIALELEFNNDINSTSFKQLDNATEAMLLTNSVALEATNAFLRTLRSMPRIAAKLNRSQKEAVVATEMVADELAAITNSALDVRRVVSEVLARAEDQSEDQPSDQANKI